MERNLFVKVFGKEIEAASLPCSFLGALLLLWACGGCDGECYPGVISGPGQVLNGELMWQWDGAQGTSDLAPSDGNEMDCSVRTLLQSESKRERAIVNDNSRLLTWVEIECFHSELFTGFTVEVLLEDIRDYPEGDIVLDEDETRVTLYHYESCEPGVHSDDCFLCGGVPAESNLSVFVEEAIGSGASYDAIVTDDWSRTLRLAFSTSATPGETIVHKDTCQNLMSATGTVRIKLAAADFKTDDCAVSE